MMHRQKSRTGQNVSQAPSKITDPRFSSFHTDPRFRLPSKKHTRTTIDKRFSALLEDEDFSNTATVDRYGRKLSGKGKKKVLERLYVPAVEEEEGGEEDEEGGDGDRGEVEVEDDDLVARELKRVDGSANVDYDPARGGGFSSSEDDEEEEGNDEEVEDEAAFPDMQTEQGKVEMGEVSSRFAVVNMDWDHVRAVDLLVVFGSFVPMGGRIERIDVFQSDFGKERMEREELEGPPREIFASYKGAGGSSDEESAAEEDEEADEEKIKKSLLKEDDGKEFDSAALRHYQLERLRYYYGVILCSDSNTAQTIYEATDGTEYLSSANFFDLRFIPDGVEFEDKPRDSCESVPAGYKPTEFVTTALQHSKVKLTWDMAPEEASRKDAIKRAFTGSRADINENDLRAYLGSDSESGSEEEPAPVTEPLAMPEAPKLTKKELARQKMRAALGLTDEPLVPKRSKGGPVGDMQIRFTAGLSTNEKGGVFENAPIIEETTAEKYVRKERERKARRKDKAKAIREGRDPDGAPEEDTKAEREDNADLGFDDPFFDADAGNKANMKKIKKEERQRKRDIKALDNAAKEAERHELELLMQDNEAGSGEKGTGHFDINAIQRAEKLKKTKKGKKGKAAEASQRGRLQEGFEMDVQDERFGKVFDSHEYAIDPSHPRFKGTEGMKKLLEEGRKKRKRKDGDGEGEVRDEDARKRRL